MIRVTPGMVYDASVGLLGGTPPVATATPAHGLPVLS
jgi:hypothetical protein